MLLNHVGNPLTGSVLFGRVVSSLRKRYLNAMSSLNGMRARLHWIKPIEAVCCFKKAVFWKCRAYNEQLAGGGEDWDLHLKVKKTGYKIARVNSLIKHHYGQHDLIYPLRKKYHYTKRFRKKYPKKHLITSINTQSMQTNILSSSGGLFMRAKETIAADPVHSLGLVAMKTLKCLFGAIGMIDRNKTYVLLLKMATMTKRISKPPHEI